LHGYVVWVQGTKYNTKSKPPGQKDFIKKKEISTGRMNPDIGRCLTQQPSPGNSKKGL